MERRTLLGLLTGANFLRAQEKKFELPAEQRTGSIRRILVLPHSHLDIGFTLPPDQVARDYKDSIDAAIRLVEENPDFRWTIESAWMLGEWLRRTEDPKLIERLGALLRSGRIALGATFASMHSGLMGAEEMNRLVYLGHSFRRRFGIKSEVAYQNDVPGFSWSYPRVLAGSGVKYLITGLNLFIGGGNNLGVANTPFYWKGPDGSRVLTWFTYDSYVEGHRWNLSSQASMDVLEASVPRRLAWLEQNDYRFDTYLLMDAVGDNSDPSRAFRTLQRIREWNRRHPELPMEMSTAEDFFSYVEKQGKDNFREVSGDAAGHWELVKLTMPEASSRLRETASLLPASEMLAAADHIENGSVYPGYDLAEAWRELLTFHEHTAIAGPGWPGYFTRWQTDWSNAAHYAAAMTAYSNTRQLFDKAVRRLSGSTGLFDPARKANASEVSVLVYNGLSWPVTGLATVRDLPQGLPEDLEVVNNTTGTVVPAERVSGTQHFLFPVRSVPSCGYQVFRLRKRGQRPLTGEAFPVDVEVDPAGSIRSISAGTPKQEIFSQSNTLPFGGLMISRRNGPYSPVPSGTASIVTTENTIERRTEIKRPDSALRRTTLIQYREFPYLDIDFDVDLGGFGDETMRCGIAFPLITDGFSFGGPGFVARVPQDVLPGGGAPQYAPLHFVHFHRSSGAGITLSSRDAFLFRPDGIFLIAADGRRTRTRDEGEQILDRTEPRGSRIQTFRFRLTAAAQNAAEWHRFAREFNLPLQAAAGVPDDLPAARSFLSVSPGNVEVLAFKRAEHQSDRYVIRLQEIGGIAAEHARLETSLSLKDAVLANLVEETAGAKIDVGDFSIRPWQTLTILVRAT